MSTKEKRIHKVPRKQSGGVRKSKQSAHRRAENTKRTILPAENRLRLAFEVQIGDGLYFTYFGILAD